LKKRCPTPKSFGLPHLDSPTPRLGKFYDSQHVPLRNFDHATGHESQKSRKLKFEKKNLLKEQTILLLYQIILKKI